MSHQLVKEYISANAQFKVSIFCRNDGLYEVTSYKWTHEIVPGYGEVCEPFWEPLFYSSITLTDDVVNAEKIADEELQGWNRSIA